MWVRKLRRKTTRNVAVQIVRNYRNDQGKPCLEIVRHMGSVPEGEALESFVRLAAHEMANIQEGIQPSLFPAEGYVDEIMAARKRKQDAKKLPMADARELEEVKRLCVGFHEVLGALYDRLGLADVFTQRQTMARRLFKQAALLRLAAPGDSKLAHSRLLSKDIGVDMPVDTFYRMMDALTDGRIDKLRQAVSREGVGLLDGKVDVLFFDVTTLAFAREEEDDLRKKGYGKDGTPHRVQVVLALVQTRQGLPVGYELFSGTTAEVKTLESALEKLQKRFTPDRVVFVADSGIRSKDNLALVRSKDGDYVVAARLRSLSEKHAEAVTGPHRWNEAPSGRKVADLSLGGRRLILRYCPKKAARDTHKREHALEKGKKRLAAGIKGKGKGGRFLKVDQDAVSLDEEAMANDRKFDALHGVWTRLPSLPPQEIYAHYGELWRMEEGFRVLKHTMAVRPVFHGAERRVRAHVAICFVAFALLRILRHRYPIMHGASEPLSEARILSELSGVEASVILDRTTKAQYLLPSAAGPTKTRLYNAVGQQLRRKTVLLKKGATSRQP